MILDLAPGAVADVAGERLPRRVERAYRRYRHGPGAFKVDLAVEGGIPWQAEPARRAGTVHAIGSFAEIVAAEREVARGRMPERPYVLVGQQYLADPGRSKGDTHPVWAYAHVPSGYDGDATDAVIGQLERFAPGLRERIVGRFTRSPAELEAYNPNYVGGDIITGANTPWQTVVRPRVAVDPYATGIPGRVHVLGRDATGCGSARDERLQRRIVCVARPERAPSAQARRRHRPIARGWSANQTKPARAVARPARAAVAGTPTAARCRCPELAEAAPL